MNAVDPYRVLGVEASWTLDEIEARYRELVLQYHPDLHRQEGPEAVATAEHRTVLLNDAMARVRKEHPAHRYASAAGSPGRENGNTSGGAGSTTTSGHPGFSDPDTSSWTTGPDGEDFGIKYQWPPPPEEEFKPKRQQPCPFCGEVFDELPIFEAHLNGEHGWDYRNAKPRQSKRRKRHRLHRGPKFSKSESYLEVLAMASCVVLIGVSIWYRASQVSAFARTILDPFIFMLVAFCAVIAFRIAFWRKR